MTTPHQVVTEGAASAVTAATVLKAMQTLAVALVLVLVAAILHVGAAPYIGFAFAGTLVIHLASRPTRREIAALIGAGAIFAAAYFLSGGQTLNYYGRELGIPGGFLGMGSFLVLAARWVWAGPAERRVRWEQLSEAGLIPALCIGSMVAVDIAAELTPRTYDRLLMGADVKFGGPPSWVIGRVFRAHTWLLRTCGWVYCSLPLALAASLLVQGRERRAGCQHAVDLRWLSLALGVAGFALYQICPAAGPVYLYAKEFPLDAPNLSGLAMIAAPLAAVPRNAMPSLHVGWTLLLFWNTRGRRLWIRALMLVYLMLTALATLGSGEHYLVDLIVAPALALAVQALCTQTTSRTRWVGLGIGSAIVFLWLFALRSGAALSIPAGAAMWTLAACSIIIPVVSKNAIEIKAEGQQLRAAVKRRLAG